jgi:predicted site-specific integrase-resolvase
MVYGGYMRAYLNAADIARMRRVHKSTVIRWIKRGLFENVERPTGTLAWRVPLQSYQKFIASTLSNPSHL